MFSGTGTGGFTFGATPTTTTTASAPPSTGFSFGTQPKPGGFNFGTSSNTTAQPTSTTGGSAGFAFGAPAAKTTPAAPTGFGFGTAPNTQAATTTSGLTFGGAASTQAAPATGSTGFAFGGAASTTAPSGFSLGGTGLGTATGQPKTVGFALPTSTVAPTASSGFTLGGAPAATGVRPTTTPTVTPTGSFTFGAPGSGAQRPSLSVPGMTTAPQAATAFTLGTPQATTASMATKHTLAGTPAQANFGSIKLGTTTTAAATSATSTASTGFTLGGSTTSTAASTGLTLGGVTASTAAPSVGFGFGATTSIAATTATTITKTTTSLPQMNYQQLEEAINKWTVELEEQEKIFLQQATQVNAWDRLLIENGEKITTLNSDVERVKLDQQRLDNELDFIRAQQRELEELLSPLEDAVQQLPSISYQQHADLEREHTYQLSENIDAQLKRMVQDLKEIIDHVNSTNTGQDNNDPIHQITKILNAHMDSLQWIDHNSGLLNRRVEEISRQMDSQRKEQERNFRLAYD